MLSFHSAIFRNCVQSGEDEVSRQFPKTLEVYSAFIYSDREGIFSTKKTPINIAEFSLFNILRKITRQVKVHHFLKGLPYQVNLFELFCNKSKNEKSFYYPPWEIQPYDLSQYLAKKNSLLQNQQLHFPLLEEIFRRSDEIVPGMTIFKNEIYPL